VLFLCSIPLPVHRYLMHNNVTHTSKVWVWFQRGLKWGRACSPKAATMLCIDPGPWLVRTLVTIFIAGKFCSVLELSIKPVRVLHGSLFKLFINTPKLPLPE
jgi:hypothetical protein